MQRLPVKHGRRSGKLSLPAQTADGMIARQGLQQDQYLIGFSPPDSQLLFASLRCMSAKNGSSGKRDGIVEARLLYEVNLLRLSESRYGPEGLDKVRGVVLASISLLRTNGFASLASDLELQLQNASRASK